MYCAWKGANFVEKQQKRSEDIFFLFLSISPYIVSIVLYERNKMVLFDAYDEQ